MMDVHPETVSILVVDDEEPIRRLIRRLVMKNGWRFYQAADGREALKRLERSDVDVVITDIAMPGMDGITLTKVVKEKYTADVIMMTGFFKDLAYEHAIAKGADDFIQKPFATEEFQIRLNRVVRERKIQSDLQKSLEQMKEVLDGVIHSLSSTVEARDPYTSGHQKRVASLAVSIARKMGAPPEQVHGIEMAGIIHDLGKIAIPAEILSKPTRLSDIEYSLIKTHPQIGYDILKDINFPTPIARIVYQHHERLDGTGYPRGLTGDQILMEARIMAVADVVEAMSSHRPYRPAVGIDKAKEEISTKRGRIYDPGAVDACLRVLEEDTVNFDW